MVVNRSGRGAHPRSGSGAHAAEPARGAGCSAAARRPHAQTEPAPWLASLIQIDASLEIFPRFGAPPPPLTRKTAQLELPRLSRLVSPNAQRPNSNNTALRSPSAALTTLWRLQVSAPLRPVSVRLTPSRRPVSRPVPNRICVEFTPGSLRAAGSKRVTHNATKTGRPDVVSLPLS
jgi:hypothetical protein